jgi:hypothetical protein
LNSKSVVFFGCPDEVVADGFFFFWFSEGLWVLLTCGYREVCVGCFLVCCFGVDAANAWCALAGWKFSVVFWRGFSFKA